MAELCDYFIAQVLSDNPDFKNIKHETRVHDWRSHVGEKVAALWSTLDLKVRLAIAEDALELAGRENWD